MPLQVSVVIRTVNPRLNYLRRTLDALRAQTLDREAWELLIVDNASQESVAKRVPLDWHPHGRHVPEPRAGMAWANLRGLRERTPGTLVVFVDDDNVPAPDYLAQALAIAADWPMLGAWGGRIEGVYEEPPPAWLREWEHALAVRPCERPVWSAFVDEHSLPFGAGLCMRAAVAASYVARAESDPNFSFFGRRPGRNVSGDDQYLCFCAQDLGLGVGCFPQLLMRHLIPSVRTTPAAFLALVRGNYHGMALLQAVRGTRDLRNRFVWPLLRLAASALLYRGMRRRIHFAEAGGHFDALRESHHLKRADYQKVAGAAKFAPAQAAAAGLQAGQPVPAQISPACSLDSAPGTNHRRAMPPKISVILCTHQPRADYLTRTLASLRAQTLAPAEWELVVVDNGSEPPLAGSLDLGWHRQGRILREERLGLAYGRVAGLEHTTGGVVVFVDDDNLLAPDYLATALEIAEHWPMLGTWGARVTPLFEEAPPPDWVKPYLYHLAVTWCEEPAWSSFVSDRTLPVGAGLCVRRAVADVYLEKTRHDPMHSRFGRTKRCAIAGDDQYICLCAESIGLGSGKFPHLRLEHLIPARRLAPASFLRVARGNAHGAMLLRALWQKRQTYRDKLYFPLLKLCAHALLRRGMRRRIDMAEARGEFDALREARRLQRRAGAENGRGMEAAALTDSALIIKEQK